jgi:nicotinamide riboside kinase
MVDQGSKASAGAGQARRVVFLGAESTGKSTLSEALARDYGTVSVPEIGRFIWEEKQGRLDAGDYVEIALKHRAAEDAALPPWQGRVAGCSLTPMP